MNKIGAYEIIGELGRGGMATVYKAYHRALDRHVAIKMIRHADDPSLNIRFAREAQIVAKLVHPNIVPVYDFSEYEGDPYLVMRFIEGASLRTILEDGPIELSDIINLIKPVASAIDYAHTQRVLHRDIKPSNILIDMQGTPYLSDFGLARFEHHAASTVSADMVLGTPYYISPEQALGKEEIDYRADLYSFGVVLYELLVGRVPYREGSPISIIHDHVYRELPMPGSINPSISKGVEAVLLRALAKDPDSRFENATELVEHLTSMLANAKLVPLAGERLHTCAESLAKPRAEVKPVTDARISRPIPTIESPQTKKRNRTYLYGALVAVVIVTLGLLVALQSLSIRAAQTPTSTPPRVADVGSADAGANPLVNPNDPASYLAVIRAAIQTRDVNLAMETVGEGLGAAGDPVEFTRQVLQIIDESGRYEMEFLIYQRGFSALSGTGNYAPYRAAFGEAFYVVCDTEPVHNPNFVRSMIRDVERDINPPLTPLGLTMFARLFVLVGEADLAAQTIARALEADPTLAEARLVNGEILAAQGEVEAAQAEWQTALESEDAPEWVHLRAEELLAI